MEDKEKNEGAAVAPIIPAVHIREQTVFPTLFERDTIAATIDLAIDIIHDAGGPIDGDHGTWKDGALWATRYFAKWLLNIELENPHE